jgi:lipopolysaccharide transport system permease protein
LTAREEDKGTWTTIIQARNKTFDVDMPELWRYRDLIMLFVRRDFIANYKQSILGPLWFLLQPLFITIVFTIVFGKIARVSTDDLPPFLFYMAGVTAWNYFATCVTKTSDTFIVNAHIFGKVYFPRLAIPISVVLTNMLSFTIQFALFLAFVIYYFFAGAKIEPNTTILLVPFLLIHMAVLGLGVGVLVSSLTTKYRDLTYMVALGVQLWMYATPVVYPASQIPEKWQLIYSLNPMAAIVETFRYAFLGGPPLTFGQLGISMAVTAVILVLSMVMFSRINKTFMDTV